MSKNPGWRNAAGSSKEPSRGGGSESASGRSWRDSSAAGWKSNTESDRRGIRWGRHLAALCSLVMLGGIGVWLVQLIGCQNAHVVVASVHQYQEDDFPPNSFADNDANTLMALGESSSITVETPKAVTNFSQVVSKAATDATDANLILYLNMLAARGRDRAFVLDATAEHDAGGGVVDLENLWDALRELERPNDKVTVLLLDVSRFHSDWRMSVIENYVLDDIAAATQDIGNLIVITSCSVGEVSWTSPSLGGSGQSAFGHYVFRALAGEADADADRQITVRELYEFIHSNTNSWVQQNRDRLGQHPMIFPSLDSLEDNGLADFELVSASELSAPEIEAPSTKRLRDSVHDLWLSHEKLHDMPTPAYERHPVLWRQFTYQLMRAEAKLHAREIGNAQRLIKKAERIRDRLIEAQGDDTIGAATLAHNDSETFLFNNLTRRLFSPDKDEPPAKTDGKQPNLPEDQLQTIIEFKGMLPAGVDGLDEVAELAIKTRTLSEQAAAQSLHAFPWTRLMIESADTSRRAGEDALFGGAVDAAREQLELAGRQYKLANDVAADVDAAHSALNRLLADLPDIAHWASHRWVTLAENRSPQVWGDSDRAHILELYENVLSGDLNRVGEVENWLPPAPSQCFSLGIEDRLVLAEAHALGLFGLAAAFESKLARPRSLTFPLEEADEAWLGQLRAEARTAQERLDEIHHLIVDKARKLEDEHPDAQQSVWREAQDHLQYALLPPDLRHELVQMRDSMDQTLSKKAVENTELSVETASPAAIQRGLWTGLWINHVIVLGDRKSPMSKRLWEAWLDITETDKPDEHRDGLLDLGGLVSESWRAKSPRSLLNRQADDLAKKRANIYEADWIARSLHGHDAQSLGTSSTQTLQELLLAEMCNFHAQRFTEDFLASPGSHDWDDDRHWFRLVANQTLDSARGLARELRISHLNDALDKTEDTLKVRADATISVSGQGVRFGIETSQQITFAIRKNGAVPNGQLAIWLDEGKLETLKTTDTKRRLLPTAENAEVSFTLRKDNLNEEDCKKTAVGPTIVFRGRRLENFKSAVNPCREEGVAVSWAPVNEPGAVLVEGADRRSVMFILDCSYSMTEQVGEKPNRRIRFSAARETLMDALSAIRQQQAGGLDRRVGLTAYGHRMRVLNDGKGHVPNPLWKLPIPTGLTPLSDIEVLQPVRPLNANHFDALRTSLNSLGAWGNTPLIESIQRAVRNDLKQGGTVVVITDGEDNGSENTYESRLNELQKSVENHEHGVEVHVVGFAVPEPIQNKLQSMGFKFHNAPDGEVLAQTLSTALNPRPYSIKSQTAATSDTALGKVAAGLSRGSYELTFPEAKPVIRFDVLGGERLVYKLQKGELQHRKDLLPNLKDPVNAVYPGQPSPGSPSRFGYRTFREYKPDNGRDGMSKAVFWFAFDHDNPSLSVSRPREVAFEVFPDDGATVDRTMRQTEWQLEPGQSTPTWRVTVHDWPTGRPASVQAWWKMERTTPDLPLVPLSADNGEFQLPNTSLELFDKPDVDIRHRTITIILRTPRAPDNELKPSDPAFDQLRRLRMELGRQVGDDKFIAYPLPVTRVFRPTDGSLEFRFTVEDDFDAGSCKIGVTTWEARMRNAAKPEKPLTDLREDLAN